MQLPQEIEVRHTIPAIRQVVARELVETHELSQEQAADLLGVSPAAISQYKTGKRGDQTTIPNEAVKRIEQAARRIAEGRSDALEELYTLTKTSEVQELTCKIHKEEDDVAQDCTLCMEEQ